MKILRNTSKQPFIIHRTRGVAVHLLPGRAILLTDDELKSTQLKSLIERDWVRIEKKVERSEKGKNQNSKTDEKDKGSAKSATAKKSNVKHKKKIQK